MPGMAVDNEVAVRGEAIHARLCFPEGSGGPGHPLVHRSHDRRYIALDVDLAIDLIGSCELAESVKGGFNAVAKIGEAIQWRRQSGAIEEKGWEPLSAIGICARGQPDLDIALHPH